MRQGNRARLARSLTISLIVAMFFSLWGGVRPEKAYASGEFDAMRQKWRTMLTGGSSLNTADPQVAARTAELVATANEYWSSMDVSPTRVRIWPKLSVSGDADNHDTYSRLRTMALAATTQGSALYGRADLKADILNALDFMYQNSYNTSRDSHSQNWWYWQIGIPLSLNDIAVLLYDDISAERMSHYMTTIEHFTPKPTLTGANRAWQSVVVAVRATLISDAGEAAQKMELARDGLSGVGIFPYSTKGDGFYTDGSFIQHTTYAYTGGYGKELLGLTSDLMYLLSGTSYEVTNSGKDNVWKWIYDSYEPLMHKGAMMDMVRGREISRNYEQAHNAGNSVITSVIRLSQIAPAPYAADFKRMAKGWITEGAFIGDYSNKAYSFYDEAPMDVIGLAKGIVSDGSVLPAEPLNQYKQFAAMDRAVLSRPGFAFGLAMFSTRTKSYEAINSENVNGWYTAAGASYLYNNDVQQYSEDYWPTVNSYRLPGTTVAAATYNKGQQLGGSWAGGVSLGNMYGASGIDLSYSDYSLTARKSYFMFDDEIVALGAGITSSSGKPIETIVENRKLNASGSNALTINGIPQQTALSTSQTVTGVNWAHLAGSAGSGSDIGYYFPGGVTLHTNRTPNEGSWHTINPRKTTPSAKMTRNYEEMWIDHGTNPAGASYAYVLLPNKSSAQVMQYASNPAVSVIANTNSVQAVKETTLNLVGANFWTDSTQSADLITSNKKASVMTRETPSDKLEVSVSDPTQANTGTIAIELARSAASYSADPGITVTQLSPTIKFTVNVNGAKGKSFQASFQLGEGTGNPDPGTPTEPELPSVIVDNDDASGVTKTGSWKRVNTQSDRYGDSYLHDNNADKGAKSVTFTPNLPSAGYYRVSMMWPAHVNREDAVQIDVARVGGTSRIAVDQRSNGGKWNPLGTFEFQAGTGGSVTIRNDAPASPDGFVVADAVKFERLPDPIIVDNSDSTGVTLVGTWKSANTQTDRYGGSYLHDNNADKGTKSVTFTPNLPISGQYEVFLMWPAHINREDAVQVDVVRVGGTSRIAVDQRSNGGKWNPIGTFDFQAGTGGSVTIRNDALASPDGFVVADAVKFVPVR